MAKCKGRCVSDFVLRYKNTNSYYTFYARIIDPIFIQYILR
jgi:hypothetical protein